MRLCSGVTDKRYSLADFARSTGSNEKGYEILCDAQGQLRAFRSEQQSFNNIELDHPRIEEQALRLEILSNVDQRAHTFIALVIYGARASFAPPRSQLF